MKILFIIWLVMASFIGVFYMKVIDYVYGGTDMWLVRLTLKILFHHLTRVVPD